MASDSCFPALLPTASLRQDPAEGLDETQRLGASTEARACPEAGIALIYLISMLRSFMTCFSPVLPSPVPFDHLHEDSLADGGRDDGPGSESTEMRACTAASWRPCASTGNAADRATHTSDFLPLSLVVVIVSACIDCMLELA